MSGFRRGLKRSAARGSAGALRRAVLAVALLLLLGGSQLPVVRAEIGPRPVAITARPIDSFDLRDPARHRFGALDYRGGLVLESEDKRFGGLSALHLDRDGEHMLSLSDRGVWLRGRIVYRDGRPAGIADAEMADMLGPDGTAMNAHGRFDTESMAVDGGTIYVGVERRNEIVRFDYGRHGLAARAETIAAPAAIKSLPFNGGLEALAFVPAGSRLGGTLIAVSERGLDRAGNIVGFLIGGPTPGAFTVRRRDGFDISDAALLPNGDLLLLERFFAPTQGLAVRVRRIAQDTIKPEALLDGAILFEADLGYQIDNMEGLAVHRTAGGETVLTLISDDNFSFIQRTLLLQFALVGE